MLKSVEWINEVSSRSSAPVTSRSSQITLALDFPLGPTRSGPSLRVRFCVVMFQKCGVLKAPWSCRGSPLTSSSLLPRLTLLAGLPLFSFLEHVLTNVPLL